MKYSRSEIEQVILLGGTFKKKRTIGKSLLLSRFNWCVAIVVVVALYNWVIYTHEPGFTSTQPMMVLLTNLSILALSPLAITGGVFLLKKRLRGTGSNAKKRIVTICIATGSAIGATLGFFIARTIMSNASADGALIIFLVCAALLTLIFIFCTTFVCYKISLMRKYYPELENKYVQESDEDSRRAI